jgi:archaellum biogenesis ATPase FlaH
MKKRVVSAKSKKFKRMKKNLFMKQRLERMHLSGKGYKKDVFLKTHVPGFDILIGKGIPHGSSVLVEGGPGSGKTIFCLEVAKRACEAGLKVLYMSFEEPEARLLTHMESFGFDPIKHIKKGNLYLKRFNALDIAKRAVN